MDTNKTILIGRATRDPELSRTPNGTAICKFSLAVDNSWYRDGEKQEETLFIDCDVWGKTGEVIAQYVKKGHRVCVTGKLRLSKWEDKDGNKRSKHSITVQDVQFLQPREEQENNGDYSPGGVNRDGESKKEDDSQDIPF